MSTTRADPSAGLTIWGRRSAFNVQKVLWLTAELDLTHDHIEVGGSAGGLDTPAFRALNPHGRVPVIDDGGMVVWESQTILRYLAARHGGGLWSNNPAERARSERWMDWAQTTLQPDFMGLFWGLVRAPEDRRDPAAVAGFAARCADHYRLLDRWLESRLWLAGERFTLADVPAGATLYRYFTMDVARPTIPRVRAWYDRLTARPGYRAHVMRPYDELRGRLAF